MQILQRQIDAPALSILAQVANDVGELKCEAQFIRIHAGRGIGVAEDFDADEADGGGDATAVENELVERVVAPPRQIHLDAIDDLVEVALRDIEAGNVVSERARYGPGRRAGVDVTKLLAPTGE